MLKRILAALEEIIIILQIIVDILREILKELQSR